MVSASSSPMVSKGLQHGQELLVMLSVSLNAAKVAPGPDSPSCQPRGFRREVGRKEGRHWRSTRVRRALKSPNSYPATLPSQNSPLKEAFLLNTNPPFIPHSRDFVITRKWAEFSGTLLWYCLWHVHVHELQ